jgi:hypothetical protein
MDFNTAATTASTKGTSHDVQSTCVSRVRSTVCTCMASTWCSWRALGLVICTLRATDVGGWGGMVRVNLQAGAGMSLRMDMQDDGQGT